MLLPPAPTLLIVPGAAPDNPSGVCSLLQAVRGPSLMSSSSPRAAFTVCVVIGVAAGCASGGHSSRTEPTPQPMITSDDIERNPGQPIEQILQAKVPGLIVSRTLDG